MTLSKQVWVLALLIAPLALAADPPVSTSDGEESIAALRERAQRAARSLRMGDALFRRDNIREACTAYSRALEARPSWWMARLAVVRCGRFVGLPLDNLVKHAEFAVRARPQIPATHLQFALVLEEAGRLNLAIAAYEEALRTHPKLAVARFRLGVLQARADRMYAARQNLEEVLKVRPDYMVARVHLTKVYEKLNLLREAELSLKALVTSSRYPARALARLIRFYERHRMKSQFDKAKKRYRERFGR